MRYIDHIWCAGGISGEGISCRFRLLHRFIKIVVSLSVDLDNYKKIKIFGDLVKGPLQKLVYKLCNVIVKWISQIGTYQKLMSKMSQSLEKLSEMSIHNYF